MVKEAVHKLLGDYDCPIYYNGYAELLDLVVAANKYYGQVVRNLKTIYHDTAKLHGTTRLCFERNLRTLVTAWSKESKFQELFSELPTNAELIVILVDLLHKRLKEERTVYDFLFDT